MRARSRVWVVGLFLALSLVCAPGRARAGAWTYEPGHFYLQLGTGFSYGNKAYDNLGNIQPIIVPQLRSDATAQSISDYQQLLTDLYFEVGALPRVTVFGDLGLLSARMKNPGGDINYSSTYLSDLLLGLRLGVLQAPVAIALEARLGIPTGDAKRVLPTGSGDFRGELRAVVSHAFSKIPIYLDFEMGFVFRGAAYVYSPLGPPPSKVELVNFSSQLTIHGEVGGTLLKLHGVDRLRLIAGVDYVGSITKTASTSSAALFLFPENSELTTISFSLMGNVWRGFGLLFRVARTLEGLRQPELTTFGGALFASW